MNPTGLMPVPDTLPAPARLFSPETGPNASKKDNPGSLRSSGRPYPIGRELRCHTCVLKEMKGAANHENMCRPLRNKKTLVEVAKNAR